MISLYEFLVKDKKKIGGGDPTYQEIVSKYIKDKKLISRLELLFSQVYEFVWSNAINNLHDLYETWLNVDDAIDRQEIGADLELSADENDTCHDIYYEVYDYIGGGTNKVHNILSEIGFYWLEQKLMDEE